MVQAISLAYEPKPTKKIVGVGPGLGAAIFLTEIRIGDSQGWTSASEAMVGESVRETSQRSAFIR